MKVILLSIIGICIIGITASTLVVSAQSQYDIPSWIKNVAGFWANDEITDNEFGEGLTFLIDNEIISVPKITELEKEIAQMEAEKKTLLSMNYQLKQENAKLKQTTSDISTSSTKSNLDLLAKQHPHIKSMMNGKVNFYIAPVPSYAGPGVKDAVKQIADFLDSKSTWNQVTNPNDSDIMVDWVKDYGSHTLGEAIFKSYIKIGLGKTTCFSSWNGHGETDGPGEWTAFDNVTVYRILWHELGHSMGYGHSSDPNNIMYPTTSPKLAKVWGHGGILDADIRSSIPGYWEFNFCEAGNYSYTLKIPEQLQDASTFDVVVVPPGTSFQQYAVYHEATYYPSCSIEDVKSITKSCNVPKGAKLFLISKYPIIFNVSIYDITEHPDIDLEWDKNAFQYSDEFLDIVRKFG